MPASRFFLVSMALAGFAILPVHAQQSLPYWAVPGRGVMAGQVVDADSGRGVPAAVVRLGPRLTSPGPSGVEEESLATYTFGMRFIVADAQGRFVIRNIGPGAYALVVITPGYMASAYGQQRPGGLTREIPIEADQRLNDVVIKAWKHSVITGAVFDEAGEPAVGVAVRALRRRFAGGHGVFAATPSSVRTDDRGEYRLTALEPADYVVVVPSTTVTVPTGTLVVYKEATSSGNSAAASSIQRDAAGLGASLSSPGIPIDDAYALLAGPRSRGLTLPSASAAASVYQTVFHPAAVESSQASVISLRSGEERAGIDVQLKVARAFRVSGTVTSPDGPAGGVQVSLIPATAVALADPTGYETATTLTATDGHFRFLGVPEGQYVARIVKIQRAAPPGTTSTTSIQVGGETTAVTMVTPTMNVGSSINPTAALWARVPIVVTQNIEDLSVPLAHGARVSGRIVFEGASAPPVIGPGLGASVGLLPSDGRAMTDVAAVRPATDWQFTTAQYPPGAYYLSAAPVGGKWSLKSATVNGKDALKVPLTLGPDDVGGVVVTFTDRPSEVSGRVRDRNGAPAPDVTVALFPSDYRAWIDGGMAARFLRTTGADRDGAYRFGDVIPGEYLAIAYPASVMKLPQDPAFIAELAPTAAHITIGDGDSKSLALTLAAIR